MNFKNLLKFSTLVLLFTIVLGSLSYGQTVRYLNSTDGDDSYTGENPTNVVVSGVNTGPKRTLEGAFTAFASGTTVYMYAGNYDKDQSGIGGGNDLNGYTIGTGANKSMTFIIRTYGANTVANLNGAGGFTLNIGTGTLKFQSETAGVQSVSLNPAANQILHLQSGVLDVSATTFNAAATIGAALATPVQRTAGSVTGSITYAAPPVIEYLNGANMNASGEVPANVNILRFSATAASTVTFANPVTFTVNAGGIVNSTASSHATFNGLVTLRANTGNASPSIVNSQATSNWKFPGGVTVRSTFAANGIPIQITGSGLIEISGQLTFEQRTDVTAADANHTSLVDNNTGGGTITLSGGVVETATGVAGSYTATRTPVVNFQTIDAGIANLGGGSGTRFTGNFTTGTTGGTINLLGEVRIDGTFANPAGAATVALGSNNLLITGTGAHTNAGNFSSTGIGVGYVDFSNAAAITWNGAGQLPNVKNTGAGTLTIANATTFTGNVDVLGGGGITISTANTIGGGSTISGAGTLTTAGSVYNGGVTMSNGGFTLTGNTQIFGNYQQDGGTLTFNVNTLDMKGNFTRTTGTVVPGTGQLQFSAGGPQTFTGGSNMQVYNFLVTSVGTGVTFNNGSLEVINNAQIIANTNVVLGTYNIRMLGTGGATPTFTNAGQYTSSGGGGIIFEGPGVGNQHFITGNGVNSNIEVRLNGEDLYVDVADGQVVTWSGVLTLTRGTIRVGNAGGAAEQFNPSTLLTTPTIRRNLGDIAGVAAGWPTVANGVADGFQINVGVGGTFNATNQDYHLEYVGTLTANQAVGAEFVAGVNPRVINLTVWANGGGFAVQLPNAEYRFKGNLTVADNAILQLTGAGNNPLVSTSNTAAHSVVGTLSRSNTGTFLLTGAGTLAGGTDVTNHESKIFDVTLNTTGTYTFSALEEIGNAGAGGLNVVAGTLNLGMATVANAPGLINNYLQSGGTAILTTSISNNTTFDNGFIPATGGIFDFANNNVWLTAGIFRAGTTGSFLATGASTGGYLQFRGNANLNTGTINVPRISVDPADAGGITATLTGNSGVSDIFTMVGVNFNTSTLALGANTFRMAGNQWNTGSAAGAVAYAGTGTVTVTGPVVINLYGNNSVPNLTLNNGTNTASLVDMDGSTVTVPSLEVTTTFTSTAGTLDFGVCDILLTRVGAAAPGNLVFAYTAGTFLATTNNTVTATDDSNGELVFGSGAASAAGNRQQFTVGTTMPVIPNVRIAGPAGEFVDLNTTNPFTVSKRLVFGSGSGFIFDANSRMVLSDGIWIKRNGVATISHVPTFGTGVNLVDLEYESAAAVVPANEMPTTVRGLYIDNTAGIDVDASKNITVNEMLHLGTGNYDFENVAGTIRTITMTTGAKVLVRDGNLINSGSATVSPLLGTGVVLEYVNTVARTTTSSEFPSTDGFATRLNVFTTAAAGANGSLVLHASRSVGDFELATGTATPLVTNLIFNLNGFTLTVTNPATSTLTRGVLSSLNETTDIYTFATLASSGPVTSTANATIYNTNITNAPSINLAGTFGKFDHDLDGAANNTLPAGFPSATVTGAATVANFAGSLTVGTNAVINGLYSNGTLTVPGDVTVGTGGGFAATANITFIGNANSKLTVPAAGATIGGLTITKTNNTNTITLEGGNLTTTANTTFVNGLIITGSNTLRMFHPLFAVGGQGFNRDGVTGTNISHVVGNVAKASVNAGGPGLGGSSVPRFEFPVGTMTLYRPVALTFNPSFGLPTMPTATTFTVSHVNSNPGGAIGLPIKDGVAPGIDVARYPAFYWTIAATPNSIGPSTLFDLELTAKGFTDFDDINNVRIIRRHGLVTDVSNQWLFQGTIGVPYDNEVSAGVPSIIQKNANAGLRAGGAVFTLGLKSNMKVKTSIPKQWLVLSAGAKNYSLANLFEGNIGSLSYSAQSSNTSIATVAVTGSTLTITPVATGDAVVTVVASDAANNDFFAYSFPVNVGLVGVEDGEIIPTEFSLAQNFPNPFNPTTNIKFGLPKESNVTLRIYNILGEEVATLVNKVMPAGFHTVNFDASRLTSGLYIYRIEADNFVQVKKMMLMK